MKKYIFLGAIVALLGVAMTGCQKPEPQPVVSGDDNVYSVSYTLCGRSYQEELNGDEAFDSLMLQLIRSSHDGCEVFIYNDSQTTPPVTSKETLMYTTLSETDAANWTAQRVKEGYKVHVSYDEETGVYTCLAFLNLSEISLSEILPGTTWRAIWHYQIVVANFYHDFETEYTMHFDTDTTGTVTTKNLIVDGIPAEEYYGGEIPEYTGAIRVTIEDKTLYIRDWMERWNTWSDAVEEFRYYYSTNSMVKKPTNPENQFIYRLVLD